jgi:hypothetical protein
MIDSPLSCKEHLRQMKRGKENNPNYKMLTDPNDVVSPSALESVLEAYENERICFVVFFLSFRLSLQ